MSKYYLIKRGEIVGEAVVLSPELVYYHLWENLIPTYQTTLEKIKKKFKLAPKGIK